MVCPPLTNHCNRLTNRPYQKGGILKIKNITEVPDEECAPFLELLKKVGEFTQTLKASKFELLHVYLNVITNISIQMGIQPEKYMKILSLIGVEYMDKFEEMTALLQEHMNAKQD